jgi:CubicO group peptidase (beta-lactamase class C family)
MLALTASVNSQGAQLDHRPEDVDAYLSALAAHGFSGVVILKDGKSIKLREAYGTADPAVGDPPMSADARFDIGSLTKIFTAALVVALSERDEFALDDSLSTVIDGVPIDKRAISIRHLLAHSSGLVRTASTVGVEESSSRTEFVQNLLDSELMFEPGSAFSYSDAGYDLLAAAMEMHMNADFEDLLEEYVLAPAGVGGVHYYSPGLSSSAPIAMSVRSPFGRFYSLAEEGPSQKNWLNTGSGGLLASAVDLSQWFGAFKDSKVVSKDAVRAMMSPQQPVRENVDYGLGWWIIKGETGTRIEHGGDIGGYKALIRWWPDRDETLVALSNTFGWERVLNQSINQILAGTTLHAPSGAARQGANATIPPGHLTAHNGADIAIAESEKSVSLIAGNQLATDVLFGLDDTETEEAKHLNASVKQLVENVILDNYELFAQLMRERDVHTGKHKQIEAALRRAQEQDPIESVAILGSIPAQDGTFVTFADIGRANGREIVRFVWRNGRLAAMGRSPIGPEVRFVPSDGGKFVAYLPANDATVTFSADADEIVFEQGTVFRRPRTTTVLARPCADTEPFRFVVGEWRVSSNGQFVGENSIREVMAGCALVEEWRGAGGSQGVSISAFDAREGGWVQTWVDSAGGVLMTKGQLLDDGFILRGRKLARDKVTWMKHEIRWTQLDNGNLRQVWRAWPEADGGEGHAMTLFDGTYVRKAASPEASGARSADGGNQDG